MIRLHWPSARLPRRRGTPERPRARRARRLFAHRPQQATPARPGPVSSVLRIPRMAALIAITILVAAASLVSFAESYRGLWLWASHHGLHGIWAAGFPAQVDVFIAVGELTLFVALADRWPPRSRAAAWAVSGLGLAVSVAGNTGHIAGHDLASRATAAVPPLAAASALAVGLGVLKRVVAAHHAAQEAAPKPAASTVPADVSEAAKVSLRATIAAGNPWSVNQLAEQFSLSRATATKLRQSVLAEANGHRAPEQETTPA